MARASKEAAGERLVGVPFLVAAILLLLAIICNTASDCAGVRPPSLLVISASDILERLDILLPISLLSNVGSMQINGRKSPW